MATVAGPRPPEEIRSRHLTRWPARRLTRLAASAAGPSGSFHVGDISLFIIPTRARTNFYDCDKPCSKLLTTSIRCFCVCLYLNFQLIFTNKKKSPTFPLTNDGICGNRCHMFVICSCSVFVCFLYFLLVVVIVECHDGGDSQMEPSSLFNPTSPQTLVNRTNNHGLTRFL